MSSIDENVLVGEQGLNLYVVAPSRMEHVQDKRPTLTNYMCFVIKDDADNIALQMSNKIHRDFTVYALVPVTTHKGHKDE